MRVGIVGCGGHRTGGWGHPPLRRVTIDFVGAAVPSGPAMADASLGSPSSVTALPCHLPPRVGKALDGGTDCHVAALLAMTGWGMRAVLSAPCGGTSPEGGGKVRWGPRVLSWLPLWGSWHGAAVTERAGG